MEFDEFFSQVTGREKQSCFPFQERLATESWPDLLKIPTGLGKTAAVLLAWIYKRLRSDPDTPRRLVYCLPMRTLVEQTATHAAAWLRIVHARKLDSAERVPAGPHVMMGGDTDDEWVRSPDKPAILIGTQDILLSRALMRGYGVNRNRWPVDFALLHNDCMWIFDEIQLMAAGLPTSAQLEAFRGKIGTLANCRSLWLSATLERDWLRTVDFDAAHLVLHSLEPRDRVHQTVQDRLTAPKRVAKAETPLTSAALADKSLVEYARALSKEVLGLHRPGKLTLIIINQVRRAQALYDALSEKTSPPVLLVHSRFRPAERRKLNEQLLIGPGERGIIVVATQAIEAGVDITSALMFTELAPWPSLVQRFGRLNRRCEEDDAQAFWIDIATENDKDATALALPYELDELWAARERLNTLDDVSPATLEAFALKLDGSWQVLRRKDIYDLFNTDPDLTGFDVDISPYVRGSDDTDVRVFWRAMTDTDRGPQGDEARRPHREEICAVSIGQARKWLEKHKPRAFVWDWMDRRWARLDRPWPGALVLVDSALGGYDESRGFDASSTTPVPPVSFATDTIAPPEGSDDDPDTIKDRIVLLPDHLRHVRDEAQRLCDVLRVGPSEAFAVITSGLWHDLGKSHDVFKARCGLEPDAAPLAKTPSYNWRVKDLREGVDGRPRNRNRRYFRHELASALAWLQYGPQDDTLDLIAYLIAAHHGKVRMGLRALPDERGPGKDRDIRFARGVWEGDRLPTFSADGLTVPEIELKLDVMEIGGGSTGRSWTTRTRMLLESYGPFRLAFLEALVRFADWRASEQEQAGSNTENYTP
jgi:CRISPR-associated endonuclease/helicase Cas3